MTSKALNIGAKPPAQDSSFVKVWDLPVRVFHWTLVLSFTLAYLSEDHFLWLHTQAGYLIAFLLLFRLLWGFVGTTHARWADFVKKPSAIYQYVKSAILGKARRYLGHNPAGGAMVLALMLSLSACLISGMATLGAQDYAGPFAPWLNNISVPFAHLLEEVHEFFSHLSLLLVFMHLAGVIFSSWQHRENLVRAMISGNKQRKT